MYKLIMFLNFHKKTSSPPSSLVATKANASTASVITKDDINIAEPPTSVHTASADLSADTAKHNASVVFNTRTASNFYSFINARATITTKSRTKSTQSSSARRQKRRRPSLRSAQRRNISTTSNDSYRSELISLEQMYQDNSTFHEQTNIYTDIMGENSDANSTSSSSMSSQSNSDSGNALADAEARSAPTTPALKSILKPTGYAKPSQESLIQTVSVLKLDDEIRAKIQNLKSYAAKTSAEVPANVSMLESMYEMKMESLKRQARVALDKFDRKSSSERDSRHRLSRFLTTTAKLLKNLNGKTQQSPRQRAHSLNNSSKRESPVKSFEVTHANYYSFERDNLEKLYESQMRVFQCEILLLVNGIDAQLREIRHGEVTAQKAYCNRHKQHQRHRRVSTGTLTKKQRIHYSTEALMQKRIRIHKHQYPAGSIQNLSRTEVIEKNKNPFAIETMV